MRKAIFLIAGLVVALVGTGGFAAVSDECSYSPDGKLNIRLAPEGIAHFFDRERECDPWQVIEPDPSIQSVTIIPYSSWTDAPARAVTIKRDGTLTISEPVRANDPDSDWPEWKYKGSVTARDRDLAERLLSKLSRFARINRRTDEDVDTLLARLEKENADIVDPQNHLVGPKIPCHGALHDGGGVNLEIETDASETYVVVLDSFCHSIAKERAIKATWDAREKVFLTAEFTGEHFVDGLATY